MKRFLLPLAASTMIMASCSTETKDSHQTLTYYDYNLIIDNANLDQNAQATYCGYEFTFNFSKGAVSIKADDLIVNNQKQSFETDTMAVSSKYFKTVIDGQDTTVGLSVFSKGGPAAVGSPVSNLKGSILGMYAPATNDSLANNFNIRLIERLDLNYTISGRYQVQTFWPSSLYLGQTYASDSKESFSSRTPRYIVNVNFSNQKANVFVYNPELSASDDNLPKVIRIGDIPVKFDHDSYYLEAASPKTTVLSRRNSIPALIDSVGFQVEDFQLRITSEDLTNADISYKLRGKTVNFTGNCVPKPAN